MLNVRDLPTMTALVNTYRIDKEYVKVCHNTMLYRHADLYTQYNYRVEVPSARGSIVRYHNTDIAWLSSGQRFLWLNTGGWHTYTTKERLSALLPKGRWNDAESAWVGPYVRLGSDRGEWCLSGMDSRGRLWSHPYHDGIVLDAVQGWRPTYGSLVNSPDVSPFQAFR